MTIDHFCIVVLSDVVLKTGLGPKTGLKTIFLRSWSGFGLDLERS